MAQLKIPPLDNISFFADSVFIPTKRVDLTLVTLFLQQDKHFRTKLIDVSILLPLYHRRTSIKC